MENTEHLRYWISRKVDSIYGGNLTAFSEHTTVSRQTWMNILSYRYNSVRQQAVNDLCNLFNLTELELYLIAHPEITADVAQGVVNETPPAYETKDEAERLADYLRLAPQKDCEFVYNAAERCGFRRNKEK